jgi:hypothetical protein
VRTGTVRESVGFRRRIHFVTFTSLLVLNGIQGQRDKISNVCRSQIIEYCYCIW